MCARAQKQLCDYQQASNNNRIWDAFRACSSKKRITTERMNVHCAYIQRSGRERGTESASHLNYITFILWSLWLNWCLYQKSAYANQNWWCPAYFRALWISIICRKRVERKREEEKTSTHTTICTQNSHVLMVVRALRKIRLRWINFGGDSVRSFIRVSRFFFFALLPKIEHINLFIRRKEQRIILRSNSSALVNSHHDTRYKIIMWAAVRHTRKPRRNASN